MIAIAFSSTLGIGTLITAVLILAVGGLPLRLIQQMREERVELERVNNEQRDELREKDSTIAELEAKTDLSSLADQQRELHVATIEAIREIASASMHESEERLGRLEAAVAGGMAAHTKELHKVSVILDKVLTKLDDEKRPT